MRSLHVLGEGPGGKYGAKHCKTCNKLSTAFSLAPPLSSKSSGENTKNLSSGDNEKKTKKTKKEKKKRLKQTKPEPVINLVDSDDEDDVILLDEEGEDDEPLTLEALQTVDLPDVEMDDWACPICMFQYDNQDYVPMYIAESYAIALNQYNPDAERGSAPPCRHRLCTRCVLRVGLEPCVTCRSFPARYETDLELLKEIVAFQGGYYVALTAQLNKTRWEQIPLERKLKEATDKLPAMEKRVALLEETERKLSEARDVANRATADRFTADRIADGYKERFGQEKGRAEAAEQELRTRSAVNEHLFKEVMAMRVNMVAGGTLSPAHIGLDVKPVPADGSLVVHVHTGPPARRGPTLVYVKGKAFLSGEEVNLAQRISEYQRAGAGDGSLEATLPDSIDAIQDSALPLLASSAENDTFMVKNGTWLATFLVATYSDTEALFDGGDGAETTGAVQMDSMYRPCTRAQLDAARQAYTKMMQEKKEREEAALERRRQKGKDEAEEEDGPKIEGEKACEISLVDPYMCFYCFESKPSVKVCGMCMLPRCTECWQVDVHACHARITSYDSGYCGRYGEWTKRISSENIRTITGRYFVWAWRALLYAYSGNAKYVATYITEAAPRSWTLQAREIKEDPAETLCNIMAGDMHSDIEVALEFLDTLHDAWENWFDLFVQLRHVILRKLLRLREKSRKSHVEINLVGDEEEDNGEAAWMAKRLKGRIGASSAAAIIADAPSQLNAAEAAANILRRESVVDNIRARQRQQGEPPSPGTMRYVRNSRPGVPYSDDEPELVPVFAHHIQPVEVTNEVHGDEEDGESGQVELLRGHTLAEERQEDERPFRAGTANAINVDHESGIYPGPVYPVRFSDFDNIDRDVHRGRPPPDEVLQYVSGLRQTATHMQSRYGDAIARSSQLPNIPVIRRTDLYPAPMGWQDPARRQRVLDLLNDAVPVESFGNDPEPETSGDAERYEDDAPEYVFDDAF